MEGRRVSILSLLFLISLLPATAQYRLAGLVSDHSSGEALSGAHILLSRPADTLSYATVSDDQGRFLFRSIAAGSYLLRIHFVGFRPLEKEVMIRSDLDLGTLMLTEDTVAIGEVRVEGRTPQAEQIGDTTQYNAAAFKVTRDASAEQLVQKLPGVAVENGKVQAHGEDVKEVMVDGRPFFDRDPMAALRNLPAEVIDKIQIFDKQSEQAEFTGFEDGNTRKVMNIVTRPGMSNGTFGRFYAGYGTDNRYMAGGNVNFFNDARRISLVGQSNNINRQNFSSEDLLGVMSSSGGKFRGRPTGGRSRGGGGGGSTSDFLVTPQNGITTTHAFGVNYSDEWGKKIKVTGSYFFNRTKNTAVQQTLRSYVSDRDSGQIYNEQEETGSTNTNHRFHLRFNYQINDNNSILFRPRLTLQTNDGYSYVDGSTFLGERPINSTLNDFSSGLQGINYSGTFLYRHKFEKKGRTLSLNVNSGYNRSKGDNIFYSVDTFFKDSVITNVNDQLSRLDADGWNISGNLMYTEPLGKKSLLEFHYQQSFRPSVSDKATWNYDTLTLDYSLLDTLQSNKFSSRYTSREGGVGWLYRQGKLNLTTRLALESSTLYREETYPREGDLTNHYLRLQGMAFLLYRMAAGKNIVAKYSTSTNPPTAAQMQEVLDNSDPLHLRTGNADLAPSFRQNLFLRFSSVNRQKSTVFFLMLGGTLENQAIVTQTLTAYNDTVIAGIFVPAGIQLSRPVNLNGQWSLRSFLTYGFPVAALKSNMNLNLTTQYSRQPGYINNDLNYAHNTAFTLGFVWSSNISENLDFTLITRSNYNIISNSLQEAANYNYFKQTTTARIKWILRERWVLGSDLSQQVYSGLSADLDKNYWIWNLSAGMKLFKNRRGEIALQVTDVLNQNRSILRQTTATYVEDVRTEVLQRYVMLTFSYNLRSFPGTTGKAPFQRPPREFRPPAGMRPGGGG